LAHTPSLAKDTQLPVAAPPPPFPSSRSLFTARSRHTQPPRDSPCDFPCHRSRDFRSLKPCRAPENPLATFLPGVTATTRIRPSLCSHQRLPFFSCPASAQPTDPQSTARPTPTHHSPKPPCPTPPFYLLSFFFSPSLGLVLIPSVLIGLHATIFTFCGFHGSAACLAALRETVIHTYLLRFSLPLPFEFRE